LRGARVRFDLHGETSGRVMNAEGT
jgi:hypothetical protein